MFETGQRQLGRYELKQVAHALRDAIAERDEEIKEYQKIAATLMAKVERLQGEVESSQVGPLRVPVRHAKKGKKPKQERLV